MIAGPWMGEVGFELLYWIPFLNWAVDRHPGLAERLHVVSRGGAAAWYAHLTPAYGDVFDQVGPDEFQRSRGERQKQVDPTAFEERISSRSADRFELDAFATLHPGYMYKGMLPIARQEAITRFREVAVYRPFATPELGPLEGVLPDDFVAVKFYFNNSFRDDPTARRFIESTLERLVADTHVVMLNTGIQVDDHWDFEPAGLDRVVTLDHLMEPATNLALQTIAISRARAYVGTYGGLSYLAPFFGVPSVSVYSHPDQFIRRHLDLASGVFADPALGDYLALDIGQVELFDLVSRPTAWRA